MSQTDRVAPSEVVARFFHLLDRDQMGEATGLFALDGHFVRGSQQLQGQQVLLDALSLKPAGQIVRHLMSNVVTDFLEGGEAVVRYDLSVYVQRPGEDCAGAPALAYIVNGTAICKPATPGWVIAHMLTEQAFRTAAPLFK